MKKINSRNKFQFLNVDNFEIILKFLNFDDIPNFVRACEKSKSHYLRQTILKLFKPFYKNKIQKSIEYVSSDTAHAKQLLLQKKPTKLFEKYLNLRTISFPKFVDHVVLTPKFRMVSHIDGFFSIEQKFEKQYSIVKLQKVFMQTLAIDFRVINLLSWIFSSKHFITFILNHQNNVFIIFKEGQILICGKTGKVSMCFQRDKLLLTSHFISRNKTFFMSYRKHNDNFVVYHISSGEIFSFSNSLKSIFLNPNSILDYKFFKSNGISFGLIHSNDSLFNQMMGHICKIQNLSKVSNPNRFDEVLNELHNN